MKNQLISIAILGKYFLFSIQPSVLSQDKELKFDNLKEISSFELKINKKECQFGLNEEQLYSAVYSYLNNNNFPVVKSSDSANANINVNIKCPKHSEFISLLFNVEIIQPG